MTQERTHEGGSVRGHDEPDQIGGQIGRPATDAHTRRVEEQTRVQHNFEPVNVTDIACFMDGRMDTFRINPGGALVRCIILTFMINGQPREVIIPLGSLAQLGLTINGALSRSGYPITIVNGITPEADKILADTLRGMRQANKTGSFVVAGNDELPEAASAQRQDDANPIAVSLR